MRIYYKSKIMIHLFCAPNRERKIGVREQSLSVCLKHRFWSDKLEYVIRKTCPVNLICAQ